jgi:hypothetical protein
MDDFNQRDHGLLSDSLGFLVGQKRLERVVRSVSDDTQEIVRLLKGMLEQREANPPANQLGALAAAIATVQARATVDVVRNEQGGVRRSRAPREQDSIQRDATNRPAAMRDARGRFVSALPLPDAVMDTATATPPVVTPQPLLPTDAVVDTASPAVAPISPSNAPSDADATSVAPNAPAPAVRDARGRFVPRNQAGGADSVADDAATPENTDGRVNNGRRRGANGQFEGAGDRSWFDKFKNAVTGGVTAGMPNAQGVDPTVDALNELGGLLSPVGKAASFALKPISMLWKRNKKAEPLPAAQEDHNREERKFWGRLVDTVRAQSAGMSGGAMLRMLPVMIPAVVAAVTAYLAKAAVDKVTDWVDEKSSEMDAARPEGQQGSLNSDGSSNTGFVGAVNRKAIGLVNGVIGGINAVTSKFRGGDRLRLEETQIGSQGVASGEGETAAVGRSARPSRTFTPDKAAAIKASAQRLGVNPNDLAAIISFETGGTFDPSIRNKAAKGQTPTSATGLLQFIEGSGGTRGKYYGMSRDEFGGLSFEAQMQYVERYMKDSKIGGNKTSIADMYNAVLGVPNGGYTKTKHPSAYNKNAALDVNKDGVIDKGEAVNNAVFRRHRSINFFPDAPLSETAATGAPVATPQQPATPQPAATEKTVLPATPAALAERAETLPAPAAPNTTSMAIPSIPSLPAAASLVPTSPMAAFSNRQAPNAPKFPAMPPVREQLTRSTPQVVTIAQSPDAIGQNVADRAIAHAVTGGLGMGGRDVFA